MSVRYREKLILMMKALWSVRYAPVAENRFNPCTECREALARELTAAAWQARYNVSINLRNYPKNLNRQVWKQCNRTQESAFLNEGREWILARDRCKQLCLIKRKIINENNLLGPWLRPYKYWQERAEVNDKRPVWDCVAKRLQKGAELGMKWPILRLAG